MQPLTTLRIDLRGTFLAMGAGYISGQMTHVVDGLFSFQWYLADEHCCLMGGQP